MKSTPLNRGKIAITYDNLKNAIKRAFDERNFARRVEADTYVVSCPRGHEHLVRVEGGFISCDCDAGHVGKHACHHGAAALSLHLAITEGRTSREIADADGQTEIAVLLDAPLIPKFNGFTGQRNGHEFFRGVRL